MVVHDRYVHLRQGSECPKFEGNNITLYSVRFSPFSERARLVLNFKKIPFNVVNIHIRNKPDWYLQKNPLGKVPTLEEPDGTIIYESLIIAEYLDDKYPETKRLLPVDPYARAEQKITVEAVIQTAAYRHTVIEGDPESKEIVTKGLDQVEKMLNSPFWAGNELGFVDLMLWPWFERLPAIRQISGLDFTSARHPKLTAWMERMLANPAVEGTAYTVEERVAFLETRKEGLVNFDVGLAR